MFRIVAILLCIIASSLVASFDLLKVIDKALKVDILPDGSFKVGLLSIPINSLCQLPLFITERLTCHICAVDCTVVHNRYSGQCGPYPGNHGRVCVCNDDPPADGRVPTPVEQCGPLTIVDIPIDPKRNFNRYFPNKCLNGCLCAQEVKIANTSRKRVRLLGNAFETVFIALDLVVCPVDGATAVCTIDCAGNHQYDYGVCGVESPVPLAPGNVPGDPQQFCKCQFK